MNPLAAYFSHSWKAREIHINVKIWERLTAGGCQLLIDRPDTFGGGKPPYFISRIETLLRRTDVFVGCLPALPPEQRKPRNPNAFGDWRYTNCSEYILFELRLAERADLPRFVLYDVESRFRPHRHQPKHVRYVPRKFDELRERLNGGGVDDQLEEELDDWLTWIRRHHRPVLPLESNLAAYCLDNSADGAAARDLVENAVDEEGFERPMDLRSLFQTDADLYQTLRSLGLLIVDVGRPELLPLYHVAHSLLVPTIRIHSPKVSVDRGDEMLPALLRGHPGGYQCDLVDPHGDSAYDEIAQRSKAITTSARPIMDFESGRSLLYERTYPKHLVFISHNEKLNDRAFVDEIVRRCRMQGIAYWEYAVENRSGEQWAVNMHEALSKTTHMVALLSDGYEQSPGCREEWDFAIHRSPRLPLLPFLTRDRSRPHVDLRGQEIAHEPLRANPSENAEVVVARIRDTLLRSPS